MQFFHGALPMRAISLQLKLQVLIGSEKLTLKVQVKEMVGFTCPFARSIVGMGGVASTLCDHR